MAIIRFQFQFNVAGRFSLSGKIVPKRVENNTLHPWPYAYVDVLSTPDDAELTSSAITAFRMEEVERMVRRKFTSSDAKFYATSEAVAEFITTRCPDIVVLIPAENNVVHSAADGWDTFASC